MSLGKRTSFNFEKHDVYKLENEFITVHHLKIQNTYHNSVKFINVDGFLLVNGDYGTYVFSRNFTPSKSEYGVSDYYWVEKLEIDSTQKALEFCPEITLKLINEELEKEDLSEEEIEYLNELKNLHNTHELDYTNFAYRENIGRYQDYEYIPFGTKIKYHLQFVFDAFEEIINRYNSNEKFLNYVV